MATQFDGIESAGREQNVPVSLLRIDYSYQRPVNRSRVQRIVRNFSWPLFGRLKVSLRDDGYFYVMEGQHRTAALRELGMPFAPSTVYEGLTRDDEERIFHDQAQVLRLSPFNLHHSGGEEARAVNELLASYGCKLVEQNARRGKGDIGAAGTVYSIYRTRSGPQSLAEVLNVLTQAWDFTAASLQEDMLRGMYSFLLRAKKDPNFDMAQLHQRLKDVTPKAVMKDARNKADAMNWRMAYCVACAILDVYNHKLRSKRLAGFPLPTQRTKDEEE